MNNLGSRFHISKRATIPWYLAWGIRLAAIVVAMLVCALVTTLLTGEDPIGVFGTIPNLKGLVNNKIGLTFDVAKTNENADFGTMVEPLTPFQYAKLQESVVKTYNDFTGRVAEGRGLRQTYVDSIGQGRVWAGADAIEIAQRVWRRTPDSPPPSSPDKVRICLAYSPPAGGYPSSDVTRRSHQPLPLQYQVIATYKGYGTAMSCLRRQGR